MKKNLSIVWFRQDLRVLDNAALFACKDEVILPIYILDDSAPAKFKIGQASKIWLYHSLKDLSKSLDGNLNLYVGKSVEIINLLIKRYNITSIFYNKCYEPWHINQENEVQDLCKKNSIKCEVFNSNFMWRPDEIMKDDGTYYKVFTAYKNKSNFLVPRKIFDSSKNLNFIKDDLNKINLLDLNLIEDNKWNKNIEKTLEVGEFAAHKKLKFFIQNKLSGYKEGRNYPAQEHVSKLSAHLHFGEISPSQMLKEINNIYNENIKQDIESFINELIWREFSCYLLYHFKPIYNENFNKKFDNFEWEYNLDFLKAWQTGSTGYPFIDAGIRELLQTGYMHNRVRMAVGSFLVKNLNIHWHEGRDWFWKYLLDADLANNSVNWQWVSGCGVDPAPYFRIFNPTLQGEKFDANGDYTRKFVPELRSMPNKYLFKPWQAPDKILKSAEVVLGKNYPKPIVDFAVSRNKALKNYRKL